MLQIFRSIPRLLAYTIIGVSPLLMCASISPADKGDHPALNLKSLDFRNYGVEQGLTGSFGTSLAQDASGFIWYGTKSGLFRFDGHAFHAFLADESDPYSLIHDMVDSQRCDSSGRHWIGTRYGISRYDAKTDRFHSYMLNPELPLDAAKNRVNQIIEDPNREIIAITEVGYLYNYDEKEDEFRRMENYGPYPGLKSIAIDQDHRIFLGTESGVFRIDPESGEVIRHPVFSHEYPHSIGFVLSLYLAGDNTIYAGTSNHGLFRLDTDLKTAVHLDIPFDDPSWIDHIEPYRDSHLIMSAAQGIAVWDIENETCRFYQHSPNESSSLGGHSSRHCMVSSQGDLWVATRSALSCAFTDSMFDNYGPYRQGAARLNGKIVTALHVNSDEIWIGYIGGGLECISRTDGSHRHITEFEHEGNRIALQSVYEIYEDHQGTLWIGAYRQGLLRYSREEHTLQPVLSGVGFDIRDIEEDTQGALWMVNHGSGFARFEPDNGALKNWQYDAEHEEFKFLDNWCFSLTIDDGGDIWLGSNWGVQRFNPGSEQLRYYPSIPDDPSTIADPLVQTIFRDAKDRLWFGTQNGLCLYLPEEDEFKRFENAPIRDIRSIAEDATGVLWLGTHLGLLRFDPVAETWIQFDHSDGLPATYFSPQTSARSDQGQIFMGTDHGFCSFDPRKLIRQSTSVPVQIASIKLFNQEVPITPDNPDSLLPVHPQSLDVLKLKHDQNSLSIGYSAIEFANPEGIEFAYRLADFDTSWVYVGNKLEAVYTNLPPGKFRFEIKTRLKGGDWNVSQAQLNILIASPFWGTWWFRIGAIALFILLIRIAYTYRVRRLHQIREMLEAQVKERTRSLDDAYVEIREKNEELEHHRENLEETVRQRTKELSRALERAELSDRLKSAFLANISHEIRTPLNAISGLLHTLNDPQLSDADREEFSQVIHNNTHLLSQLIDDILKLSRIESGEIQMELEPTDIKELLSETFTVYQDLLVNADHKESINLLLDIEELSDKTILTDPMHLRQVLANLLNNAIKFTERGTITLSCRQVETSGKSTTREIHIEVKDTGVGIEPQQLNSIFYRFHKVQTGRSKLHEGVGIGLSICKSLTELLGGRIEVESDSTKGSLFRVCLPMR